MTIRQALMRLLDRGGPPLDPGEAIEVAIVPIASGPMTVESLRDSGFDASGDPTYNIITEVASDYRIMVPRQQAAAASARLGELL